MKATGYQMDATLENGVLTVEGRGKVGKVALDWDMGDRIAAVEANADEGQGGLGDAKTRAELKDAVTSLASPSVPVADITSVEFKDANALVNGSITIHAYGKKAKFHFRRKTREECRALYEEIQRLRGE